MPLKSTKVTMAHHSEKTFYLDRVSENPEQLRRRTLNAVMAAMDVKEGMLVIPAHDNEAQKIANYTPAKTIKIFLEDHELDVSKLTATQMRDVLHHSNRPYLAKHFDVLDVEPEHPEKGFLVVLKKAHATPQHKKMGEFLLHYHTIPEADKKPRAIFQDALLQPEKVAQGEALSVVEQKNFITDMDAKQDQLFAEFSGMTQKHVGNVGKLYRAFLEAAAKSDTGLKACDRSVRGETGFLQPIIKLKDGDLDVLTAIAELHDIGKFRMSKALLEGKDGIYQGSYEQVMDKIYQRNAHAMGGYQIFSALGEKGGDILKAATMIAGRHHMHDKMQNWKQIDEMVRNWKVTGERKGLIEVIDVDPDAVAEQLRKHEFYIPDSKDADLLKEALYKYARKQPSLIYDILFKQNSQVAHEFTEIVAKEHPEGTFTTPLRISYGALGGHSRHELDKATNKVLSKNDGRTKVSVTPFEAKMLAVVDVYEALVARRTYQKDESKAGVSAKSDGRILHTPAKALNTLIRMANDGHLNAAAVFEFIDKDVYNALEMSEADKAEVEKVKHTLLNPSHHAQASSEDNEIYHIFQKKAADAGRRLDKEAMVYFATPEHMGVSQSASR
jgi:hypothetical protein